MIITASGGARGKKTVPLKQIVDKGIALAAKEGWKVPQPLLPLGHVRDHACWWCTACMRLLLPCSGSEL